MQSCILHGIIIPESRTLRRVSGNLSGVGDGFPNTSLVLVEHGFNAFSPLVSVRNVLVGRFSPEEGAC